MRQLWITGPDNAEVREVPEPEPGPGEVAVDTVFAGICGSDLHTLHRGHPWLPYPIAPGHEASGRVALVGDGVRGLRSGDRVYLQPAVSCGDCFYCRRNRWNLCDALIGVGSHTAGAFSDRFVAPASAVRLIPEGVSWAAAALIEPLATAVHAVQRAGGVDGATVTIIGGGSIGQCVLIACREAGAQAVTVVDPIEAKRQQARELGALAAIDPGMAEWQGEVTSSLGGRPDVIMDCVATRSTLGNSLGLAVKGGTVVIVGVGHGLVEFPIEVLQDNETAIVGSAMYVEGDFRVAERLASLPQVEMLVTHVADLQEAPAALNRAARGLETKIHLRGSAEVGS